MITITVARRPLEDAYVRHVPKWQTGLINIDACRIPIRADDPEPDTSRRRGNQNIATTYNDHGWKGAGQWSEGSSLGRWPTNLILCPEAAQGLDRQSGLSKSQPRKGGEGEHLDPSREGWRFKRAAGGFEDKGGASRFFKVIGVSGDPPKP